MEFEAPNFDLSEEELDDGGELGKQISKQLFRKYFAPLKVK